MKASLVLLFFVVLVKISFAQQAKQNIDYQYFRDEKIYYAFDLYRESSGNDDLLMLNFTANIFYKKVDKIYLKEGSKQVRLKFKHREEVVKSDNPELKYYPISFSLKDLSREKIGCEAEILFKLDNGSVLTLPFNMCTVSDHLARN